MSVPAVLTGASRWRLRRWGLRNLTVACLVLPLAGDSSASTNTQVRFQYFGSTPVSTGPGTFSEVGISLATTVSGLRISLKFGKDFKIGKSRCSGLRERYCEVPTTFRPLKSGIRTDAILITDSSDNVLSSISLAGTGLGPEGAVLSELPARESNEGPLTVLQRCMKGGIQASSPGAVVVDSEGDVYFADTANQTVEKIESATGRRVIVAGTGSAGSGTGLRADQGSLDTPVSLTIDSAGNLYIADQGNHVVRRVDSSTNMIGTVAAYGGASRERGLTSIDPAHRASCQSTPSGLAMTATGTLYVSDRCESKIWAVDISGQVSLVAGGTTGSGADGLGDGGPAVQATLNSPSGIAISATGDIYIADTGNNLIRVIHAKSQIITTLAGNGEQGYSGDLGPATRAALNRPSSIRLDAAGDVFIVDTGNNAVREVDAATGSIRTIAGSNWNFNNPRDIALDGGNIYIADTGNHVLRQIGYEISSASEFLQLSPADRLSTGNRPFGWIPSGNLQGANRTGSENSEAERLTASPSSLQFTVGAIGEQSTPQLFAISNNSGHSIELSAVSITGPDTKDFRISSSTCETVLPSASHCEISVVFSPQYGSTPIRSASLNVHSGTTYILPLSGASGERSR